MSASAQFGLGATLLLLAPALARLPQGQPSPPPAVQTATQMQTQTRATSVGFWDLPEAKMRAMLADPPFKEEDRYARLRRYFTEFGCTGDRLTDMTFEKQSRHPALLCTLPGASGRTIIVTARYARAEILSGASDGWPEAVVLPMLYHALQAQPRRFTFVFAELSGTHAEAQLLVQSRRQEKSLPLALATLSALGFGPPGFSVSPENTQPAAVRPNNRVLQTEAWRIAGLEHIDTNRKSVSSSFVPTPDASGSGFDPAGPRGPGRTGVNASAVPDYVPEGSKGIPSIVIHSTPVVLPGKEAAISLASFHQDHEYIAFLLSDLDMKLNGSP